jgi:hypothetical protein
MGPHESLWEDPLDLLQMAYKEALLVHVVAVMRLYVILVDLLLQDSKVLRKTLFDFVTDRVIVYIIRQRRSSRINTSQGYFQRLAGGHVTLQ